MGDLKLGSRIENYKTFHMVIVFSGLFYFFRLFIETSSLAIFFMSMNLVIQNQFEFVILALQNNCEQKMVF